MKVLVVPFSNEERTIRGEANLNVFVMMEVNEINLSVVSVFVFAALCTSNYARAVGLCCVLINIYLLFFAFC